MGPSIFVRNSIQALIYRWCYPNSQTHSTAYGFHGKLYSTGGLLSLYQRRTRGRQKQSYQGEQVCAPCGSTLSMSSLLHSSSNSSLHFPCSQIPFLMPHPTSLSNAQEKLPINVDNRVFHLQNIPGVGYRGFSTFQDDSLGSCSESESDDEGAIRGDIIKSSADPKEVERVCKVIDELFAMDRNMEAVLDECGVSLSSNLVVEVLDRFCHARKPAFRFFRWAGEKQGFSHDSSTYNVMLNILAKNRQFETMQSMLDQMGAKGLLTMETFIISTKAFAAAKERKKAIGIFELMKKYKFTVGVETMNCLLDSLGRANLGKEAETLFERLKDRFTPNLTTYTVLLNGWCKVKNLMEAGRIWNGMIDKGFKPDIVTHNIMLEGLLKSKKRSDAIKLFHVMKAKGPSPNVRTYTIMIQDFCHQAKMREAVEYFDEMLYAQCQPDTAVYTCLIKGFGNLKRIDIVHELLNEMQEKGCPPDGRTYNALIKMMSNQQIPDAAAMIYKTMIEIGIDPTIHTYNRIMRSFFMTRNYEMGQIVWDEMIRKGCCPNGVSYTILIKGLISQRRSGEACRYLDKMLRNGMKPPQLDYNKLAADFSRDGEFNILDSLAQKMKFFGKLEVSNVFERWADTLKKRVKRRDRAKPDGCCV